PDRAADADLHLEPQPDRHVTHPLRRGRMTRSHRDERGSVMALWALLLVSVVGIVAIVIDLGALRYDRRADRAAADAGATAGAIALDGSPAGPRDACDTAWAYTVRNLRGDPANVPS